MKTGAPCDACAAAAANPVCGMYRTGCRECVVRRLAKAPRHEREMVYAIAEPGARAQLMADVRAAWARLQGKATTEGHG